jgi:beta-N-acetylhexosaminidase
VVGDLGLGGVLLMRPGLSEADLTNRIGELDAVSDLGVIVATDEEGGDVQRLRDIEPFPSQFDVSSASSPEEARMAVAQHGAMVARVGVDVVLGPVVDVLPLSGEPPLQQSRFFNGDASVVTAFAREYVAGWRSAGLIPVLKHFPGHGSASGDTHHVDGVTPPIDELELRDLVPYRDLAESGVAVMVGHLTVPGLTVDEPASTSAEAIAYLRQTLGYGDSLVVSDALDMAAAGGSVPSVAVEAIAAGVDVVLFTSPGESGAVIAAIENAVTTGQLSVERIDDAASKVLDLLEQRGGGCR